MRKTKIIATIGPSSQDPAVLEQLIDAGMDCARLNFSHGTLAEHGAVIDNIRRISQAKGKIVAILQDLGGIKLRLGEFEGLRQLARGDSVSLAPEADSSRMDVIPFPQPGVLRSLRPGNQVFISDGAVRLEVTDTQDLEVRTLVRNGGTLSSHKGVNLPGVAIDQPVLTPQDEVALQFGAEKEVDWVAVSFVRSAADIRYAREHLEDVGSKALVMAKLERGEGIDNIDSILAEADGVMVARGDMGVEIPTERVPIVQKEVVAKANEAAKISAIATQMLASMVTSPIPTRAEVSDITNAVLDGCDAILLSDETAVGRYPVETVEVANATILETEKIYPYYKDLGSRGRTQAIASAAGRMVRSLGTKPIVITSTGRAAFELSRYRPDHDVLVFSHDEAVLRRLSLGWGLYPVGVIPPERDVAKLVSLLIRDSLDSKLVTEDDVVTIVHGFLPGVSGTTNTIQVLDLKEFLGSGLA
ncbi:MAG: pyruvate kinase [SAR202 cluster bacterium Io17-Chloro-G2]|nr:MAG: pyruvate kinase [SAR202 cluster bacterium Io17-Chloro-G2]